VLLLVQLRSNTAWVDYFYFSRRVLEKFQDEGECILQLFRAIDSLFLVWLQTLGLCGWKRRSNFDKMCACTYRATFSHNTFSGLLIITIILQVILCFRDADAKANFNRATASYKGLKGPQKGRAPKQKGLMSELIEATTPSDLKTYVISKLNNNPVALKEENIRIYKKTQLDTLERLGDHEQLFDGTTYFALEVFTMLPMNVYRNVRLDQIYPATLCLPQCRNFTKVSPFMTAAMSRAERVLPWYDLVNGKELVVRGISVYCDAAATKIGNLVDPYLGVLRRCSNENW